MIIIHHSSGVSYCRWGKYRKYPKMKSKTLPDSCSFSAQSKQQGIDEPIFQNHE